MQTAEPIFWARTPLCAADVRLRFRQKRLEVSQQHQHRVARTLQSEAVCVALQRGSCRCGAVLYKALRKAVRVSLLSHSILSDCTVADHKLL